MTGKPKRSELIAQEALDQCGADFRLHGRDRKFGWDCIGLAAHCLNAADIHEDIPSGYSLRGGNPEQIARFMKLAGFVEITDHVDLRDGDVVLVRPGPLQLHLMIRTGDGFVHAHAGLRKVVFSPGPSPWPITHIFRYLEV